tara:strand:+ start:501 stop:1364 length:864 start_codon:yes stop_codon:yes gene_type:complete
MDGILLGGGSGKRLSPLTTSTNKHLLPIFDKPMIYYSLSILLLSKIKTITLICDKDSVEDYRKLLGSGEEFGITINYSLQDSPEGLPHAINTGLEEYPMEKFMVVLGDNFLYGREFFNKFENGELVKDNFIFYQKVKDPSDFGILEFDNSGELIKLIEKPTKFISNFVAVGVYIFDSEFSNYYSSLKKSKRGEYEIIDIINQYIDNKNIKSFYLGRGMSWLDMGSYDAMISSSNFVKTLQERQDILINSPHEISYRNGWISDEDILNLVSKNKESGYFTSLKDILSD